MKNGDEMMNGNHPKGANNGNKKMNISPIILKIFSCVWLSLLLMSCHKSPELAEIKKVSSFLKSQYPVQRRLLSFKAHSIEIKYWFGFYEPEKIKRVEYPSISKYFPKVRLYKATLLTGTWGMPTIEVYIVTNSEIPQKCSLVLDPMTGQMPFSLDYMMGDAQVQNKEEAEALSYDLAALIEESIGMKGTTIKKTKSSWLDIPYSPADWDEAHRITTSYVGLNGKMIYEISVSYDSKWKFIGVSFSPIRENKSIITE